MLLLLIVDLNYVDFRDVSFYIMSGFWAFYIFWSQEIRLVDSVGFLVLYLVYILVVVLGRYINQKNKGAQRISELIDVSKKYQMKDEYSNEFFL